MNTALTLVIAIAGAVGAIANAIVQIVHCRRDKRQFNSLRGK